MLFLTYRFGSTSDLVSYCPYFSSSCSNISIAVVAATCLLVSCSGECLYVDIATGLVTIAVLFYLTLALVCLASFPQMYAEPLPYIIMVTIAVVCYSSGPVP